MKDNEKTYRIGEKIALEDDLTLQYAGADEKKTYKKGSILYAMKEFIKLPDGNYWIPCGYKVNGYDINGMVEYIGSSRDIEQEYLEPCYDEDIIEIIKVEVVETLAELLGEEI